MHDPAETGPMLPRLFVSDFAFAEAERDRLRGVLGDGHAAFVERGTLLAALAERPEADAVCTFGPPANLYDVAPNLRWLALPSAGAEIAITRGLVRPAGPVVTTASGVHAVSIGEHVFGMLLMWVRGWPEILDLQRRGEWRAQQGWPPLEPRELSGSTLGIVGLGAIGRSVARIGRAFGMHVLATHRSASAGERDADVDTLYPMSDLPALLAASDYIVLAAPATDETRHLIGAGELALLRPHAFLVNIARGSLIDESALIAALESRRIGGAGLDVFEREPLPPESPLWRLPNVILSPHVAGATDKYGQRLADLLIDNITRLRVGQPLRNVVDPGRGY
jgi:phosphoglycerate dehydrogenase-like enzyme